MAPNSKPPPAAAPGAVRHISRWHDRGALLAHGFTTEQIVELIRAGLATATAERVVAGGKAIEVARVKITEAGRRAIGDRA
jgi:hypothetical protein